jgi:hypothetical protein
MRAMPAVLTIVLLAGVTCRVANAAPACLVQSGQRTVPLVELYTSEGCSSCPPADRWFSQHVADGSANWLAFHVDYWDDIGWRDRFGNAAYSKRQRARVAAAGESVVYTPQFMIGANVQAPWRDSIAPMLAKSSGPALASLTLRYEPGIEGGKLALGAARAAHAGAAQVWLAQYSDGETTRVAAGENAGVTLHHDRVVRRLWGPWPLAATPVSQRVAVQAPSPRWGVTAIVQDSLGRVWQSLNLPAASCAAK